MFQKIENGFSLVLDQKVYITHTNTNPAFLVGKKDLTIEMNKGEFEIQDDTKYIAPILINVTDTLVTFDTFQIQLSTKDVTTCTFLDLTTPIKIRFNATKDEKIYGLGEHFTSLNLRGHLVKNWVEEHITRKQIYNKIIKRLLKLPPKKWKFEDYKTYFIIPSFISSENYFCHFNTDGYGTFDFKNETFHEITFLSSLKEVVIKKEPSLLQTSAALIKFHGITPKLPDWAFDGMILGIQGGTTLVDETTKMLRNKGAKINGIWSQDWCGELYTYFGKQVLWNWEVHNELYPDLKKQIQSWEKENIKFLAYINPYLYEGGELFKEAKDKNFLVRDENKEVFLTQATSFKFGIVDLTNPDATKFFKNIIKRNYIDLGIKGWMADFGEYLPAQCILHQGTGEELHNLWPDLWIKLNREVLEETNTVGEILFFNRAGYKDNSKYTTLIWNGDQHVDFTDDFGMASAVRAYLSLSLSGIGISHSDVGGYTTVPGIKRSSELYIRWLEMNTFNLIMRSHEGNKPWVNSQPYSNAETIQATILFTNIHSKLKPYLKHVEEEYHTLGYPTIRPTFFYSNLYSESSYYLGEDLYVVPVLKKRVKKIKINIPEDNMIHLFTNHKYQKGEHLIEAPLGTPPVFYKESSVFANLFKEITDDIKKDYFTL